MTDSQPVQVDAQDILDRLSRELTSALTRAVVAEASRDALARQLDEALSSRLQGDA